MKAFSDILTTLTYEARGLLYLQGEFAQLTSISYEENIKSIKEINLEVIPIVCPVGITPDGKLINSTKNYTKDELISRYQYLGLNKLPIDGIYKLVTIMETLLNDILKKVLIEFPQKIPNKRKVDVEIILKSSSLVEAKLLIVESILNEVAYKSPKEYAEEFNKFVGINLFEFPVFHRYIELKATRDIHIHNEGTANDIYLTKAGTMARVKGGIYLPVDIQYFLQSYEFCIQLTEILEEELDKIWPSKEYRDRKNQRQELKNEQDESVQKAVDDFQKTSNEV